MKRTGKCPKCDSLEIYNNEETARYSENSLLHLSGFSRIGLTLYVCTSCGFTEEYFDKKTLNDSKKMTKVKSEWKKE